MTTSFEAHEWSGDAAWYHDAVIYEVHVRAFADANGDGIGDFRGLTTKLDYLRDLGVTTLWLLPFYPSPLRDDGYDIADYKSINSAYGTMTDFRQFLREAHNRDLKVITELVINHTSDQHPWFQRARRAPAGSPERDFYVWSDDPDRYADARIIFQDTETSNWSWDPVANAYYWHRFFTHQPDLNFESADVHDAVFDALDFWLDLGVDGLRLDAVPYLFEREGTMCENLPETHAFLKEVRARVDARYEDRMLLAEANQWPEDAVAYFGDGDECHMCFHFPLMPRLFMSLRMENRFPIIDILEQTPPIPEGSAWAIFLRNHDELTLEMVTDEERDYMYRVYADDPQTRINVGIRRRLAPLLGNNRREIELMNALLLSLPGTPVLYYGDEIGMGDNVYLGDRNGVRTPMQWSGDRNAGFSDANPQRLYFPIITDPEYHYETVNVEVQRDNPNSLWWWVKRALTLRKAMPELSRGSLEFVPNENPKVLAFLRTLGGGSVLVVANLSRHSQPVELDLNGFEGVEPVELFGRARFPAVGPNPYLLTIGPHDFFWFELDRSTALAEEPAGLRRITVEGEVTGVLRTSRELERALVGDIEGRRWFRSKAQTIRGGHIVDRVDIPGADCTVAFVQIDYVEGDPEVYAFPIAVSVGVDSERRLLEAPTSVIAEVVGRAETGLLYDASAEPAFGLALTRLAAQRKKLKGKETVVSALPMAASRGLAEAIDGQPARPGHGEQSNTSVMFGDQVVLKLFRRFDAGPNPEVEVGRFLTESSRFENAAQTMGALEVSMNGRKAAFAVFHRFVPSLGDAWSHTLDALSMVYEQVAARRDELGSAPAVPHPLEVGDDELDVMRDLIGIPLHEARLLGQRTAEMHLALASATDDPAFTPERLSTLYQRSLYQSTRSSIRTSFNLLRRRRSHLTPEQEDLADSVLGLESTILDDLRSITTEKIDAVRFRIHGDYHLGQVLFTGNDFVIIDFEGEPQRPISERRIKRLGLRDVAGMIRSYQYTTQMALREAMKSGVEEPGHTVHLAEWGDALARWLAAAFLRGYLATTEGTPLIPVDHGHLKLLLDTLVLDKAAYELSYELNNRPDWVDIPLRGLLLSSTASG
ncbi:MAG TPA: maltose alpha-D-glucosyltransferase [Acidimicrobiia bacterium]|nr:maltose alpha-D-glucosyltransferase [Acidimicrobiia bacterium]